MSLRLSLAAPCLSRSLNGCRKLLKHVKTKQNKRTASMALMVPGMALICLHTQPTTSLTRFSVK